MPPIKWATPAALSLIIRGDATPPTLKNLANGSKKLGSEVDGETDLVTLGAFELKVRGASAFTLNAPIELYIVPAIDATPNYADGDDSIDPPFTLLVGSFIVRAVTTQQRLALDGIRLPPFKWKPLIWNKGGAIFTNTDNENELRVRTYTLTV